MYNIKTPQGMLVISAGMYKETRIQSTIQGLIIILFGLILTPKFGIVGVMIASILSNLYRVIDLIIFIPKKLTHRTIWSTVKRIIKMFAFVCIMFIINYFFKMNISSYFTWVIYATIMTISIIILIAIYDMIFERKQVNNLKQRIKTLFRR